MTLAIVAAVLLATGCARGPLAATTTAAGPVTTTAELTSGGRTRAYEIYVPSSYHRATPVPLVIAYHGYGSDGAGQAKLSGMSAVAEENGFIVVYPDGVKHAWNDDRGGITGEDPTVDDVAFTRDLSDLIAAVAPVSALLSPNLTAGAGFPKPIPILIVQDTADPLVPYDGGRVSPSRFNTRGTVMSAPDTAAYFARLDGCSTSGTRMKFPDTAPKDGAYAQALTYDGGRNDTEVELVTVDGGGHTWPGGPQYLPARIIGPVCRDFQASDTIWQFFARHRLAA
jgi:polyhydroxybutyrate depolymerase